MDLLNIGIVKYLFDYFANYFLYKGLNLSCIKENSE